MNKAPTNQTLYQRWLPNPTWFAYKGIQCFNKPIDLSWYSKNTTSLILLELPDAVKYYSLIMYNILTKQQDTLLLAFWILNKRKITRDKQSGRRIWMGSRIWNKLVSVTHAIFGIILSVLWSCFGWWGQGVSLQVDSVQNNRLRRNRKLSLEVSNIYLTIDCFISMFCLRQFMDVYTGIATVALFITFEINLQVMSLHTKV